ncbi:MAG: 4a-hydroxytetrahydrobiopterin dehydratase [Candidatus Micrarchaeota archaeon]
MVLLSKEELTGELRQTRGWWVKTGEIAKDFSFPTDEEAEVFATNVRVLCKAMDRHPVLQVEGSQVFLATHSSSEDGVTQRDVHLAKEIEKLASPKPVLQAVTVNR